MTGGGEGEGEAAEVGEMSEVVGDLDSVVGGSGETMVLQEKMIIRSNN